MNILSRGLGLGLRRPFASELQKFFSSGPGSAGRDGVQPIPKDQIEQIVKRNKIVVFMKGVPDQPRCGFSNAVVQILRMHGVTNYDSHDVLQNEDMREGVKVYANWPTIPQVYINGEFVGGCDIMIQMHQNGELVEQLKKVGIKSALVEDDSSTKKE